MKNVTLLGFNGMKKKAELEMPLLKFEDDLSP